MRTRLVIKGVRLSQRYPTVYMYDPTVTNGKGSSQ